MSPVTLCPQPPPQEYAKYVLYIPPWSMFFTSSQNNSHRATGESTPRESWNVGNCPRGLGNSFSPLSRWSVSRWLINFLSLEYSMVILKNYLYC